MLSKARLNFLKKNCLIYVSKGVIWASEYSLGPQIWGPGGPGAPGPPTGSATDKIWSNLFLNKRQRFSSCK